MHLSILATVILTVVTAEKLAFEPMSAPWVSVAATIALAVFNMSLNWLAGRIFARRFRTCPTRRCAVAFRHWRRLRLAIWLGSSVLILFACGWARVVRQHWGLEHAVLLDELLCLLPALLPVIMIWRTDHLVDQALTADHGADQASGDFARYALTQARHHLILGLTPVLLLTSIDDLLSLMWTSQPTALPAFALAAIAIAAGFPTLLRWAWDARPLPLGPLRTKIMRMNQRRNVRVSEILVWKTGGRMANAAVAGYTPWSRVLLLTDRLLDKLNAEEVEAIWEHEAAHIHRHHLFLRLAVLFVPLCGYLLLTWLSSRQPSPPTSVGSWITLAGLLPLIAIPAIAILLGWVSRICEFDADLWACRRADATLCRAKADNLSDALRKLGLLSGDMSRDSWLHPSIARRIEMLEQARYQPQHLVWLDRRISWLHWGAIGVLLVLGLGLIASLSA